MLPLVKITLIKSNLISLKLEGLPEQSGFLIKVVVTSYYIKQFAHRVDWRKINVCWQSAKLACQSLLCSFSETIRNLKKGQIFLTPASNYGRNRLNRSVSNTLGTCWGSGTAVLDSEGQHWQITGLWSPHRVQECGSVLHCCAGELPHGFCTGHTWLRIWDSSDSMGLIDDGFQIFTAQLSSWVKFIL